MRKLGLALGAGGSRGVAHVGFLKALEKSGIKPQYICGSSIGAVVGASYASGMSPDAIWEIISGLHFSDFMAPSMHHGGIFTTEKMRDLLKTYLGDITFADLKLPFRCVAVDTRTQRVVEFSQGSLLDAVVASCSIPGIFQPVIKDGMRLVDGGVLERVPVEQVKKMGADVVVAVDVLGKRNGWEDSHSRGKLLEVISLMDPQKTQWRKYDDAAYIDFWLEPRLGDMPQYDLQSMQFAYDRGYDIGEENAPKIKRALEK